MVEIICKVASNGSITIPKTYRETLGIEPADMVKIDILENMTKEKKFR